MAGAGTAPDDDEKLIAAPPFGAAAVSPTVQVKEPPETTDTGMHENPFRAGFGEMVTVLPLLETAKAAPLPSAALPPVIETEDEVDEVEADTFSETVATTPLDIGVAFTPMRTQVICPVPLLQ